MHLVVDDVNFSPSEIQLLFPFKRILAKGLEILLVDLHVYLHKIASKAKCLRIISIQILKSKVQHSA